MCDSRRSFCVIKKTTLLFFIAMISRVDEIEGSSVVIQRQPVLPAQQMAPVSPAQIPSAQQALLWQQQIRRARAEEQQRQLVERAKAALRENVARLQSYQRVQGELQRRRIEEKQRQEALAKMLSIQEYKKKKWAAAAAEEAMVRHAIALSIEEQREKEAMEAALEASRVQYAMEESAREQKEREEMERAIEASLGYFPSPVVASSEAPKIEIGGQLVPHEILPSGAIVPVKISSIPAPKTAEELEEVLGTSLTRPTRPAVPKKIISPLRQKEQEKVAQQSVGQGAKMPDARVIETKPANPDAQAQIPNASLQIAVCSRQAGAECGLEAFFNVFESGRRIENTEIINVLNDYRSKTNQENERKIRSGIYKKREGTEFLKKRENLDWLLDDEISHLIAYYKPKRTILVGAYFGQLMPYFSSEDLADFQTKTLVNQLRELPAGESLNIIAFLGESIRSGHWVTFKIVKQEDPASPFAVLYMDSLLPVQGIRHDAHPYLEYINELIGSARK